MSQKFKTTWQLWSFLSLHKTIFLILHPQDQKSHQVLCFIFRLIVHEIKMRENWNFLYSQNGCLLVPMFVLLVSPQLELNSIKIFVIWVECIQVLYCITHENWTKKKSSFLYAQQIPPVASWDGEKREKKYRRLIWYSKQNKKFTLYRVHTHMHDVPSTVKRAHFHYGNQLRRVHIFGAYMNYP